MTELSPEKIELLKQAVDVQARMLAGCTMTFSAISELPDQDPMVTACCDEALQAIRISRLTLDALIERIGSTIH